MKQTRLILSAALLLSIAACTKEMTVEVASTEQQITLTAYNATTKASLQEADGKVFWEAGDKIKLYYTYLNEKGSAVTKNTDLTADITAPSATSKFTGTISTLNADLDNMENPFWGVYPSKAASSSDGHSVKVTLPAMQVAHAGTFDPAAYITIGTSKDLTMGFQAVGGGIRFSVTRDDIKSVSIKGANPADTLAGSATLIIEEGVPSVVGTTSASMSVVLNAPEGETLEPGKYYYITTLPVDLKDGFEMTFRTAKKSATRTVTKAVTIKRSTFGTIDNADADLKFEANTWCEPYIVDVKAGSLAMEINPLTKMPVLAMVQNVDGSKGPLMVYNMDDKSLKTVSEITSQYVSLGVAENGKAYVFTHNTSTKKGEVYTSPDLKAWAKEDVTIDQTNAYYGQRIGTLGNEAFVMTCNNTNGGVQKRNINVTSFNGTSWSTGNVLAGRPASTTYFPVMATRNGVMYTFVTNVGSGLSIYKYDGTTWSTVIDLTAEGEYARFGFGIQEAQGMAIAPDGQIWLAIATSTPAGIACIKIDPEETDDNIVQIGDLIPLGSASRSAQIAIGGEGEAILAYRNENDCLCTAFLNNETWEWNKPEVVTTYPVADVIIRMRADGVPVIAYTANNRTELVTIDE